MQRFRIGLIVGDQGDRLARRHDMRNGLDQSPRRSSLIGTQAGRGLPRLVAMPSNPQRLVAPSCGTASATLPVPPRRASRTSDAAFRFAGGGRKHRRSARGIAACMLKRLLPTASASFTGTGCGAARREAAASLAAMIVEAERKGSSPARTRRAASQPCSPDPSRPTPSTKARIIRRPQDATALLPPKPKELLSARLTFAWPVFEQVVALQRGSTLRVFALPGTKRARSRESR